MQLRQPIQRLCKVVLGHEAQVASVWQYLVKD